MALVLKDRVKESSNTTGTGTFSLGGAYSGFQSFSVVGNSNTTYYAIVNLSAAEWEVGIGTYTASGSTLSRDTILESSNSGSAVNFSAGTKDVFCTYPAEKAVTLDDVQTLSNKTIASPSVSGNLTFTGTGNRITGNFSNATIANRVAFQTSTANGNTNITCLPNGTGTVTNIYAFNSSDPANSSYGVLSAASTAVTLSSGQLGTGTYLPMTFYTGGSERMRIDTSGNVGIGTSSPSTWSSKVAVYDGALSVVAGSGSNYPLKIYSNGQTNNQIELAQGFASSTDNVGYLYNRANAAFVFGTNNTERARIDSSGNLLVGTTSGGFLGCGGINLFGSGNAPLSLRNTANATGQGWLVGPNNGNSFIVYNQAGTGVYVASGATTWSANSDERLKTEITPFENAVEKVASLRAGTGRYLTDDEGVSRSFLIAQDVQKVLPEAVNVQGDEQGTLGLQYTDMIPLLVAAIKEQQALITQLQAQLTTVSTDVVALKGN